MSAKLKRSVLRDGKVYPAGTEATDALREAIPAKFWDDDADPAATTDGGDLAEVRQLAAAQIAEHEKTIGELEGQIEALKAENDDLRSQVAAFPDSGNGADENHEPAATVDYDALDVEALKAEIDRRNEGRDDEAKLSKRGGKDTLADTLRSDDEAAEA